MTKYLVIALMLCAGFAYAQTNPGGASVSALTGGTVVSLSDSPTKESAPKRTFFLVSREGRFHASFWKYAPSETAADANGYVYVGGTMVGSGDTLTVPTDLIYPVQLQAHHIFLRGDAAPVDVDVYWYQ